MVSAADAGILVCSGCLAQDVREARSQDNSDSCVIVVSWEMTHFSLFPIFSHLSPRLRAGGDFLGPSSTHSCECSRAGGAGVAGSFTPR